MSRLPWIHAAAALMISLAAFGCVGPQVPVAETSNSGDRTRANQTTRGTENASEALPSASRPSMERSSLSIELADYPKILLVNTSQEAHRVLVDELLQPARLRVFDPDGHEIRPEDERDVMKFDNTVRESMFITLLPGQSTALGTLRVREGNGVLHLRFGPYSLTGLPVGQYRAKVVWKSAVDQAQGADGSQSRVESVWLGSLESEEFLLPIRRRPTEGSSF